ncbi:MULTISPECIES: ABC transporter ATP-binding protein [unclassified Nocardioides]|uniref:ABC transporter ATP-binding protein n=1 Tax=unclassified Nocardioides TaxID=2615069 RepID=UPI0006F9F1CE|nr:MULTISPECIES: ABC transporter ATP-binding protein [unclassified Nocardioides]KQY64422.1 ABC transporter [Nocardioides sp. Root140]KRF18193.1 ABC transporter [Nocardioides sp. Soil796]
MQSTVAIRAHGVIKTFGDVIALDGVDLDVPTGQIHGLVGPNGAGKTTLLGLLLGLATADGGRLEILGTHVGRALSVPAEVAGFVDGPGLYPMLTARQNLATLASLRGGAGAQSVDGLLERVGLGEVAGDPVRGFSLGMRQRLGLAAALLGEPRLLVLDEPANGLDPAGKRQVHQILADLSDAGTTVVLSSHRMDDLAALCDEVTLLSTGRVVFSGPLGKLAAEGGELDYRLVTSDPEEARRIAGSTPGLRRATGQSRTDENALVVRGPESAVDHLVVRLVGAGISLRELGPVVPPLEAAFLALTATEADSDSDPDPEASHARVEEPTR